MTRKYTQTLTQPAEETPVSSLADRLSPAEAAAMARVTRKTIGRWVEDKRFLSHRPIAAGSGRRWIDRASFLQFLAGGL